MVGIVRPHRCYPLEELCTTIVETYAKKDKQYSMLHYVSLVFVANDFKAK